MSVTTKASAHKLLLQQNYSEVDAVTTETTVWQLL